MAKRRKGSYFFLTILKPDISALIQIFQKNLVDVDFFIDELRIDDIAQLDRFSSTYQAKSILARGYRDQGREEARKGAAERSFVELRVTMISATLIGWEEEQEAATSVVFQVERLLLRCQNTLHTFIVMISNWTLVYLFLSLLPSLQQHHVGFLLQIFVLVGAGVLQMVAAFSLFVLILRGLKMQTSVFLFPGAESASRAYGRREALGRLVITLTLVILISAGCQLALHLLWR